MEKPKQEFEDRSRFLGLHDRKDWNELRRWTQEKQAGTETRLLGSAFEMLGINAFIAPFKLFHHLESLRYQGPCWMHLLVLSHGDSFLHMICHFLL